NTNIGAPFADALAEHNPYANHIYYAPQCEDTKGRLLVGHGQKSFLPASTPYGLDEGTGSNLAIDYYSSSSSSTTGFYHVRAAISFDGRNFTILGTNRYFFNNRTASATVFNEISKDAPSDWFPNPVNHADEQQTV